MTLKEASLTLVGCGHMGSAMLSRWLKSDGFGGGITIITPRKESVAPYLEDPRCRWMEMPEKGISSDLLVFAVKPQRLADILPLYKNFPNPKTLILSVAAGKPLSFYATYFAQHPFVRLMPNTPVTAGKGITLAVSSQTVSEEQKKSVSDLLSPLGSLYWLPDERPFDTYSALTGSGPAFVFAFVESLGQAAADLGLDSDLCARLAEDLVIGSAAYLASSSKSSSRLREEVTSPRGMTEAGLDQLTAHHQLRTLLRKTLEASAKRARELGRET